MPPSPRELATRLGVDQVGPAQAAYRTAEHVRYFARGYRWAQRMPEGVASPPARRSDEVSDLEALAAAHSVGPGIFKWQHYFDIYDRHLGRFRGQEVNLVEIGIYGGGSLGLWREYLGADADICGVDINPDCKRFEDEGVEVAIGDQADRSFWSGFIREHPAIDIVIDDGGHLPEQQAVTLECLLPAIRPGGVYVCEDIHGPFQPFHSFVDGLTRPLNDIAPPGSGPTPANAMNRQIASVHRYPILTVIEKNTTSIDEFESRRYGTEWPGALPPGRPVEPPF
jgi:hypothetical protein